ncbi:protein of unknown function (plasmid) [Pararobbsia alpina]
MTGFMDALNAAYPKGARASVTIRSRFFESGDVPSNAPHVAESGWNLAFLDASLGDEPYSSPSWKRVDREMGSRYKPHVP